MKPVLNNRFDLTGNEMSRLLRLSAFGKFIPIGNLRGGPGLRCLVVLSVLHYFGYPVYFIKAKYGHRLGKIKALAKRVLRR